MSWDYGALASEVYDLDKPIGTSFADVEYYLDQLKGVDGPVLEPAVGTGRVMIPLLVAGLNVEGFDTSPEMLGVCRRHCKERDLNPKLWEADMADFVRSDAYAAVIVPAGSFALLDGNDAARRALQCSYQSLRRGGQLIIDLDAPRHDNALGAMRHWSSGEFILTLQTLHVEYNPAANQTTRWLRYDKWRDGELVSSELQPFRLQHWSIGEFSALLAKTGFGKIRTTADYRPDPPGLESDEWTFHAERQ